MYNGVIFNEIDELDHFTKAVRGGRPLDRKSAAALILLKTTPPNTTASARSTADLPQTARTSVR